MQSNPYKYKQVTGASKTYETISFAEQLVVEQKRLAQVYIRTYTGGKFYPFAPKAEDVSIFDIAHSLSQQCRFSGHTKKFYSVAQHSVLVGRRAQEHYDGLNGLLHDAAEAYLVDLPTPIKKNVSFQPEWRLLDNCISDAVAYAFGIESYISYRVKNIDRRMLLTEQRDLMMLAELNEGSEDIKDDLKPYEETIEPWSSEKAEEEFLKDFLIYKKKQESYANKANHSN